MDEIKDYENALCFIDEAYLLAERRGFNFAKWALWYRIERFKMDLLIYALRALKPRYHAPTEIRFINGNSRKIISLVR